MFATPLRILVPTSERKNCGGTRLYSFGEAQDERETNRYTALNAPRRHAVSALMASMNGADHQRILGLDGSAAHAARKINLEIKRAPLLPALEREAGPLFNGLVGLPPLAARRLRQQMLLVCPLLGVLAPTDLVPEYRCPIGAQLPDLGSLHTFWKPHVTATLNRLCRRKRVFSFLTGRLQALWSKPAGTLDVIQLRFARRRGDRLQPENAGAGRLAGALARAILEEGYDDATALESYRSAQGHVFSPRDSQASADGNVRTLVFVL